MALSIPDILWERVVRTYLRTYVQRGNCYPVYWLVVKYLHVASSPPFLRLNSLDDCHDLLGISHVDLTRQLANRFANHPHVKFSSKFIRQPLKFQDTLACSLAATACRLIIVVELSSCGRLVRVRVDSLSTIVPAVTPREFAITFRSRLFSYRRFAPGFRCFEVYFKLVLYSPV